MFGAITRLVKPETLLKVAAKLIKNVSPDLKDRIRKDVADWEKLADKTVSPVDDLFVSLVKHGASYL